MVDGWDEVHADLLGTDYSTVSLVACGLWLVGVDQYPRGRYVRISVQYLRLITSMTLERPRLDLKGDTLLYCLWV